MAMSRCVGAGRQTTRRIRVKISLKCVKSVAAMTRPQEFAASSPRASPPRDLTTFSRDLHGDPSGALTLRRDNDLTALNDRRGPDRPKAPGNQQKEVLMTINLRSTKLRIAVLAPLAALTFATSLPAQERRSEEVHYGGLDLSRPEGVAELDRRIAIAVRHVCGPSRGANYWALIEYRECAAEAKASARLPRAKVIAQAESKNWAVTASK